MCNSFGVTRTMGPIGSNFSFEDTGLGVRLTVFLMEVLDMESHLTLLDHTS